MIIVLNERVLETLLSFGFYLVEEGRVGYWRDGYPKWGFKVIGPRYLSRGQSKRIASSVMNGYSDIKFSTRLSSYKDELGDNLYSYLVEYEGKEYNFQTLYKLSPHYLLFIEALKVKAFDLIYNNPQWAKFINQGL